MPPVPQPPRAQGARTSRSRSNKPRGSAERLDRNATVEERQRRHRPKGKLQRTSAGKAKHSAGREHRHRANKGRWVTEPARRMVDAVAPPAHGRRGAARGGSARGAGEPPFAVAMDVKWRWVTDAADLCPRLHGRSSAARFRHGCAASVGAARHGARGECEGGRGAPLRSCDGR